MNFSDHFFNTLKTYLLTYPENGAAAFPPRFFHHVRYYYLELCCPRTLCSQNQVLFKDVFKMKTITAKLYLYEVSNILFERILIPKHKVFLFFFF